MHLFQLVMKRPKVWFIVAVLFIAAAYGLGIMSIDYHWSDWLADGTPFAWLFPVWIRFMDTGIWYEIIPLVLLGVGAGIVAAIAYRNLHAEQARRAFFCLAFALFATFYWLGDIRPPFIQYQGWGVVLPIGWHYVPPIIFDAGFCESLPTDLPFATKHFTDSDCFPADNPLAEWLNLGSVAGIAFMAAKGVVSVKDRKGRHARATA